MNIPSFNGRYIVQGTAKQIQQFKNEYRNTTNLVNSTEQNICNKQDCNLIDSISLSDIYYPEQEFAQELILTNEHCLAHTKTIQRHHIIDEIRKLDPRSDLYQHLDLIVTDLDKIAGKIKYNRLNNTKVLKELGPNKEKKLLKYKSEIEARKVLGKSLENTQYIDAKKALKAIKENCFDFTNGIILKKNKK